MSFEILNSLAGYLEPGDATRYGMVAVEKWDTIEVVVMNDSFFDKITFLKRNGELYRTFRGERTSPWTIKAAQEMRDRLVKEVDHGTSEANDHRRSNEKVL